MKDLPYTALVRINDITGVPASAFTTIAYQIAMDYKIERPNVNSDNILYFGSEMFSPVLYKGRIFPFCYRKSFFVVVRLLHSCSPLSSAVIQIKILRLQHILSMYQKHLQNKARS